MSEKKLQIADSRFQIKSKSFLLFVFLLITYYLSLITAVDAVPAGISDLTALAGNNEGEIILTWTAPGSNGMGGKVDGYVVKYRTSNVILNGIFSDPIVTSYPQAWTGLVSGGGKEVRVLTGFVPAQLYYFAIKASYAGVYSVWNSSMDVPDINLGDVGVAKLIPPSPVTDLAVATSYKSITLSWTSPGDDGTAGDITAGRFEIRYSTLQPVLSESDWDNAPYRIDIPTSTAPSVSQRYTVTGLTNGTTYYFAIKTRDENNGGWSGLDTTSPEPFGTPVNNPPLIFNLISPASGTILTTLYPSFDWEDTTDPDGEGIASYGLQISFSDSFSSFVQAPVNIAYSSFTLTEPLQDDKTYYWRAKAVDVNGGITYSSGSIIYVNIANSPPTRFALLSPDNETVLKRPTLSWEASSDPDPPWNINYTVCYSTVSDFSEYLTTNTTATTLTFTTNLLESTTYYWKVLASDEYIPPAVTTSTRVFSFYVKPVLPSAPANVQITNGVISWSPVLLDEDGAAIVDFSKYKIYRSSDIKNIGTSGTFAGYTTLTSTPAASGEWTVIRAVDEFANESANSTAVNPDDANQILVSNARDLIMEIPLSVQPALSNTLISISKSGGIYEIKPLSLADLSEIHNFEFSSPVKITFETDDDCVFWYNGKEYVALGGKRGNSITIQTKKLGLFYTGKIEAAKLKLASSFPTKIFTPNGDGINDEINLTFTGVTEDITGAEIFDITGKKVSDMTNKDFSWFVWDGKNSDGKTVLPGVYIYQVKSGKNVCNGTVVVAR